MTTLRFGTCLTIGTLALSSLVSGPRPLAGAGLQLTQTITVTRVPAREGASGWLGLGFQRIEAGTVDRIVIESVWPGGPADRAGLRGGDRVLQLNGSPADLKMLESMSSRLAPGDPVSLTVARGAERLEVALRADPRPSSATLVVEQMQNQLDSVRHVMTLRLDSIGGHRTSELPVLRARPTSRSDSTVGVFVVMEAPSAPSRSLVPETGWTRADSAGFASFAWSASTASPTSVSFTRRGDLRAPADSVSVNRTPSAPLPVSGWSASQAPSVLPANPFVVGMNRVAGAALQEVDTRLGAYLGVDRGLLVTDVTEGTPAHRARLRSGDVIVEADGRPVGTVEELRRALVVPGQGNTLTVTRLGERRTVQLRR